MSSFWENKRKNQFKKEEKPLIKFKKLDITIKGNLGFFNGRETNYVNES